MRVRFSIREGFCNHFAAFNSASAITKHRTIYWAVHMNTHNRIHTVICDPSAISLPLSLSCSVHEQRKYKKWANKTFYKIFNFQIHKTNYEFESSKPFFLKEAYENRRTLCSYSSQYIGRQMSQNGREHLSFSLSLCPHRSL